MRRLRTLSLLLASLMVATQAFAQAVGELPGLERAKQAEKFRRATPAQKKAIEEAAKRKAELQNKRLTIREAEDARKKVEDQEKEEARKKATARKKAEEERAHAFYDEPLVKPLRGQRSLGAPINRPGDKPAAYKVELTPDNAAWAGRTQAASRLPAVKRGVLPMEANQTLLLIKSGGPFPFPGKDGSVFGNRERVLPSKPRGYYREYTVATPGAPDRGARRLIVGAGGEIYYTDNHYRSFKQVVN